MLKNLPLVGLVITFSSGQYDYVSDCPEDNGFFADALQCDRYYECTDGEVNILAIYQKHFSMISCRFLNTFVQMDLCSTRQALPMQNVGFHSVSIVLEGTKDSLPSHRQVVLINMDISLCPMKPSATSSISVLMGCQTQSHALVG